MNETYHIFFVWGEPEKLQCDIANKLSIIAQNNEVYVKKVLKFEYCGTRAYEDRSVSG